MKIRLYPKFEEVFTDETLKGIFYPLCSVILDNNLNEVLHFVSSNGTWMDEKFNSENNSFSYTLFELIDNKYKFNGNIKLYKGNKYVKAIFENLERDFEYNGNIYLKTKTRIDDYIKKQKQQLGLQFDDDFDVDYYLQTFYEYSINKLNYQINGQFGAFRSIIDNWENLDKSPIIYNADESFGDIEIPKKINLSDYKKIGEVLGSEFFSDGNNSILLYNEKEKAVLNVNSYS